jgi:hypothetical protein
LRDAALILGVSQLTIENEYYIVDLPLMMRKVNEQRAGERLQRIEEYAFAQGVPNDENERKRFIDGIVKQAGMRRSDKAAKFDRDKFEQLRMVSSKGGSKAN